MRIFRFAECVAPSNGVGAFPTLGNEIGEVGACTLGAVVCACQHRGGAASTYFSLASAHAYACATTKVYKVVNVEVVESKLHFADAYVFAFADEAALCGCVVGNLRCHIAVAVYLRTSAGIECERFAYVFGLFSRLAPRQRHGGCCATAVNAEFAACQIGSPFCHKSVGHQFSAGDCDKSVDAVACCMVEQDDSSADVAPRRVVVGGYEGTNSGIGSEYASRC